MKFKVPEIIYTSSPMTLNLVETVCNEEVLPLMNKILKETQTGVSEVDEKDYIRYYIYMSIDGIGLNFARTMFRFSIYDLENKGAEEILRTFYIDSIYYKYDEFESNLIRLVVIKKKFENKIHEYYLSKDEEIEYLTHNGKKMKLDEFLKTFIGTEWQKESNNTGRIGDIVVEEYGEKREGVKTWIILQVKDKEEKGKYKVLKHVKVVDTLKDKEMMRQYLGRTNYYEKVENRYVYKYSERPIVLENMPLFKEEVKSYPDVEFGVYDFETYEKEGTLHVYAAGVYTEKEKFHSFYLTDFKNEVEMIKAVLEHMKKTKVTTWFAHNGGRFDTILFLNLILKLKKENKRMKIEIGDSMMHENKFYQVKIKYGTRYRFKLRDSYLLLPTSLRDLAKELKLETEKGYFPHKFVNLKTLDYVGPYPNIKHWELKGEERERVKEEMKKTKTFNLKEKSLEYLEKDCFVLFQVLNKFHKEIYELFKVDMFKSLTLPSLALRVWKNTIYYKKIGKIKYNSSLYRAIKAAYFGGFSEVYIPVAENAVLYDIRSLYPTMMLNHPMPINDVLWSDNPDLDYYNGFCYVKVKSLEWKEAGYLPKRVAINTHDKSLGEYLTAPNGTWTGWYSTIELKNAAKNGYKIEVIQGYHFKTWDNIFDRYVTKLGNIKKEATGARRAICKYLLNSLYGRFGILNRESLSEIKTVSPLHSTPDYKKEKDTVFDSSLIKIDDSQILKTKTNQLYVLKDTHPDSIININPIGDTDLSTNTDTNNQYVLVEQFVDKFFISHFTNIAISASISAYARVSMCPVRNWKDTIYHDTDSVIVFKGPITESIDNSMTPELGSWAKVTDIKKIIILKPKFYVIVPSDDSPIIFKTAGLSSDTLNLQEFEKLIKTKDEHVIVKNIERTIPDPIKLKIRKAISTFTISNNYPARVKIFGRNGYITTTNLEVNQNKVVQSWYKKAGEPLMDHTGRELHNLLLSIKNNPYSHLYHAINSSFYKFVV